MGIPVMILGESGTGKSASLRNFDAAKVKVVNVAAKPLPFKNKFETVNTDIYSDIKHELKNTKKKSIVIDDSQYLMANEFMRRATERGYDKFTEIAQNMWDLVNTVKELPQDVIVYFLTHLERDQNGNEKVKTIGKLLDEKITLEGMFTIVLKTNVTDGQYTFLTQNSGHDTVKSPIGLFPSFAIENDLHYVDEKIRNYYELGEFLSDEEIKEIDEAVKKDDIPITGGRSTRKSRRTEVAEATEPTRRRRGSVEERDAEREEIQKANAEAVVNAGQDDERDEVPYEEVKEPEVEKLPRRRRRAETPEAMTPPAAEEATETAEAAPTRRRRRRAE